MFVGTTTTVQVAVTRPIDAPITQPPAGRPPNDLLDSGLGYRPATKEQPFGQNISAILISPPQAPPGTQWTPPTAVTMAGQPPAIISRAEWGADESLRCETPEYDRGSCRGGPPHRGEQRLLSAGVRRHSQSHLHLPQQDPGLV